MTVDSAATPSDRRGAAEWLAIIAGWLLVAWQVGYVMTYGPLNSPAVDYIKHWEAARALMDGASPYFGREHLYLGFNYPLFTAWIYWWLGYTDAQTAELWWELLNVALGVGGGLLAAWGLHPGKIAPANDDYRTAPLEEPRLQQMRAAIARHWWLVCLLVTVNFQPLLHAYLPANVDILMFFCYVAVLVAVVRAREVLAGVLVASLALMKIVPVLLIVAVFGGRRWRTAAGLVGALIVYALVLLTTGEWRTEAFLYQDVLPKIGHFYLGISYSIHKWLAMQVAPGILENMAAFNRWVFFLNATMGAVCMVPVLWLYWTTCRWKPALRAGFRRDDTTRRTDAFPILAHATGRVPEAARPAAAFEYLLVAVMAFITPMSPLLEYHHLVWMAPAMYLHLRNWVRGWMSPWMFVACGFGWILAHVGRIAHENFHAFAGSGYYLGGPAALWLAGCSSILMWQCLRPSKLADAPR